MRFILTLFLSLFSLYAPVYGQALIVDSTRFITGNRCCTGISYSIPTADHGTLFVGYDNNNPGGIVPYFPVDTGGALNVLIIKTDSNRAISWIKVYGGSGMDLAASACQTPDGGYAVLATTTSNDGNVTGFKGGNDFWLLKLDSSGNLLWEKTYGGSGGDQGASVANTPDHGLILLGTTNHADFDVPYHYGGYFTQDWLLIKTDSTGTKQWARTVGGTGNEQPYCTIVPVDSFYYIIGSTDSCNHDCSDSSWHPGVYTSADYNIIKLNDSGYVLWNKSYGGSLNDVMNFAMFDIGDSTIVITGYSRSNDYMVTGGHGQNDIWVVKVNLNGTLLWQKALGGIEDDDGIGICPRPGGGYLVYGSIYPGPLGGGDIWLFDVDTNGNEMTGKIFGGTLYELPKFIGTDKYGYCLSGLSESIVFNEGTTNGRITNYQNAYISYIDYWPLGLSNISTSGDFMTVFPNPTKESIKVNISSVQSGNIKILNNMGQTVLEETVNSPSTQLQINVRDWLSGVYCVVWYSRSGEMIATKFVKE